MGHEKAVVVRQKPVWFQRALLKFRRCLKENDISVPCIPPSGWFGASKLGQREQNQAGHHRRIWRTNSERRNMGLEPDTWDFKVELLLWWWASLSWTLGSSPMTFQKGDWDDFPIWCLVWRIWPRRGGLAWDQGQDCWAVGTVSQQAEGLAEGLLSRICWVWDQVPSPVLCICQAVHTRGVGRSQWRNQSV